ncbi:Nucleolar pre-ribosomal-associated protein 1 [Linum perenne]
MEVELPKFALKATPEVKLRELLHKINSVEIKLCSDATKEFIKLLKSDVGGEFLRQYVHLSSNLSELMGAWNLQQGKPGMSYIFSLISEILGHPEGKYQPNNKERVAISGVLDRFSRSLIEEKLDVIHKELNSKEVKHQNAALMLLSSIVRRGSGLASDVAKNFDFKLQSCVKLGDYKKKRYDHKRKHSTRKAFVRFGLSFLEMGKPGLLRWILQQKEMFSGILRGLGNDDDETVVYVLSTLRDRVLTEDSLVPPALRSVLFGSVTLEQLVGISGRESGGLPAELAHNVLLMVCTDPCNGLMPDSKRQPNPLRGNPKRLLDLMKKLRATETNYHRDLLLEIVKRNPFLGAAYMEEIPYNLEDFASPAWFNMISLAANLVSSVSNNLPFSDSPSSNSSSYNLDVQRILHCISPRSFNRSVVNKGLLHSDFLVKNGTLRFVFEVLKLLDSFFRGFTLSDSAKQSSEKWASVKQDIQNELRTLLPDPQVLLTLLSPLSSQARNDESGLKRKNGESLPKEIAKKRKKLEESDILEDDVIVGGIDLASDIALSLDDEVVDAQLPGDLDSENDYMELLLELWVSDPCLTSFSSMKDAETFFYAKLLDTLKVYLWVMPAGLETSFDFFMNLLNNPLALPSTLQSSLLGLLVEYVRWSPRTGILISTPPFMYKHLQPFINLLIFSPISDVKIYAYKLAQAAMFSSGAFDRNVNEIVAWFLHLPGFTMERSPCMEGLAIVENLSQAVISFVCDATSTVGNSLFRHWNVIRDYTDQLTENKGDITDVSPDFSPLSICVLQKCMRLLSSESVIFSLPEKSMISLYVCNTLKYLLQTQVDPGILASVIQSVLVERLQECGALHGSIDSLSEWRPLKNLLLFAGSILQKNIVCCLAINETDTPTDSLFGRTIGEAKKYMESDLLNEKTGSAKAFLAAMVCASPAEVLSNFPSVMAILHNLQIPLMFFGSVVFLEPSFLSGVLKLWPKIFFSGLELAVSTNSSKSMNVHSIVEEMTPCIDIDSDKYSSAGATFANFLRQAPFHVLFAAIINFDAHHLSESSKIVEFLFTKLSVRAAGSSISDIRLLLFWFNQIRLSYELKPLADHERRAEVCHILIEHLLGQLLSSESESECCMDSVILPEVHIGEVANTILCHPVISALLISPLSFHDDLIAGDSSTKDFCDSFDVLLTFCGEKIHKIDNCVLKLMMMMVDISVSSGRQFILDHFGHKRLEKALHNLVQTLCREVREKFDLCIETEDWVSFLPLFHVCHALARIVSPFELLKLVNWVFDQVKMRSSTHQISWNTSALPIGFCLAADAFETLTTYLQLGITEGGPIYGMWEQHEKCFDPSLIEKVYAEVCKYATEYELNSGYMFLLKAVNAVNRQKHSRHGIVHPLSLVLTKVIQSTPIDVISHCVSNTSRDRAKLLALLVEMSPLFSSAFGHLLLGALNKDSCLHDKVVQENCSNIAEENYLLLLPASLSYLNSVSMRFQKKCHKHFSVLPSYYARVLINGFRDWKNFVCRPEFQESYDGLFPCSLVELVDLVNNSVLGKSICMLRHHFSFSGMEKKDRLKLFKTVWKISDPVDRLLDCNIDEIELYSVGQSLNLINRVLGKISFLSLLLFAKDSEFMSLTKETYSKAEEASMEEVSVKEGRERTKFINMLVSTWCDMVKKFPPVADGYEEEIPKNCLLYRFLETFILRMILQFTVEMTGVLIQLKSIKFLDKLTESVLLFRLKDPLTLEVLRKILASLSMGRFSCSLYLQRLLSHSQFAPMIHGGTESVTSSIGTFFKPMSSILRSLAFPCSNSRCELQQSNMYLRRLEVVKLLRVLVLLHLRQSGYGSGGEICINLKDLYFLLLTSYGATVCEVDLVIHSLMRKLESIDESILVDAAKMNYLWGKSALGMRKVLALNKDPSSAGIADTEAVDEHQRNYYRENFPIDPRICAATVMHFPYQRFVIDEPLSSDDSQLVSIEDTYKEQGSGTDDVQLYDPVFLLEFSVHTLSVGYIDPMEFAGLGLLAVAFVSISSPDSGIKKLGYEALGRYKAALEMCKKKKETMGLRLLMTNIQNAIEEPWQRIPSVISLFAAESSFILLNSSNDNHSILINYLENSSRVDMKKVPLFSSNSINFRAERLWILRLIYAGLNLDEDGQLFIYNSVMKELLSLYTSPLSDDESKKLILHIIKKSVKLHKIARHLVRDCGLLSWLSSVLPISSSLRTDNEKDFFSEHLLAIVEVIIDVVSSRGIVEWLQNHALEQLMGLASHVYKVVVGELKLLKRNVSLLNAVLQILVSTLKISQKRKIYQPHFTLSFEGLVQIYQAFNESDDATSCKDAELGLQAILMSIPPPDIFLMEEATISRFLMWAISVALASDSRRREIHSKSSRLSTPPGSEESQAEEGFLLKLLRWLVASAILGKLSSTFCDVRAKYSGKPTSNLQCLLEFGRIEASNVCKLNSQKTVAASILYIQQLLGMECSMLPSAVSALCLLLLCDTSQNLDSIPGADNSSIVLLSSRVRFPPEANSAWRWTYFQPWKDLSFEQTDAVKVEEYHACQMLSVIISNCVGKKKSLTTQSLSHREVEKSGVFEWERSLIEEDDLTTILISDCTV